MKTFLSMIQEKVSIDESEINEASLVSIEDISLPIQKIIKKLDSVIAKSNTSSKRDSIFDGVHGVIVRYKREMVGFRLSKKDISSILSTAGNKFRWMEGGNQSLTIGLES